MSNQFELKLNLSSMSIIAGAMGSGKRCFQKSRIENSADVCNGPPNKIIYCYRVWQPLFDEVKGIKFQEGNVVEEIPNERKNHEWLNEWDIRHCWNRLCYTKYGHHMSVSIFFVVRKPLKKQQRTIPVNCHFLFCLRISEIDRLFLHKATIFFLRPFAGNFFSIRSPLWVS